MNVLHVVPSFHPAHCYGGPIQSVYSLCRQVARNGWTVRVLTTNANGRAAVLDAPVNEELELEDRVRVTYCSRVRPDSVSLALLRKLPAYVRSADVVHITAVYSFPVIPALMVAKALRKPVVWSPRGSLQRWDGSSRLRMKDAWDGLCRRVRPARLVLHVTSEQEAAESLMRYPGVPAAVIPNGVDVPETVARECEDGRLRILFLGRLHPKKGIENLLRACSQLTGAGLNWSLVIAGSGDAGYAAGLRRLIQDLGISASVEMPGEVLGKRKQALFARADVAVCPSTTENFALVVAEALAHEVPVVASRNTPWQHLTHHGCGLWVYNDPATLRDSLIRIAGMPLRAMGRRGRKWMQSEFTWQTRAAEMSRLYSDLAMGRFTPAREPAGAVS